MFDSDRKWWWSAGLALTLGLLVASGGCNSRTVGSASDAAGIDASDPTPDAATPVPDGTIPPDGCTEEMLRMGFSLETAVQPTPHNVYIEQWDLDGVVTYLGPPAQTSSSWHGELHLLHDDGTLSLLMFTLPVGMVLPLAEGAPVHITFRHSTVTGIYAHAVVITRPTSGVGPLMFVADVGGMLGVEDDLMSPMKVYRVDSSECPDVEDICGVRRRDALRFDTSTGGMMTDLVLEQGVDGTIPVFGDDFHVVNVGSGHYETLTQDCTDFLYEWVYYAAVRVQ